MKLILETSFGFVYQGNYQIVPSQNSDVVSLHQKEGLAPCLRGVSKG